MEYHDELERMRARKQRKEPVSKLESKLDIVDLEHVDYTALDKKDINIQKKRLAKRKRKKRILTIEFLVLIILVVCIGAFFKKYNSGYWTIAIFGVDSRDGNLEKGALSDVEMLCVIDRKTGEMKLVSVFRDTYLQISSDGTYHKINEAYFKGGHKQAVSALERNLDLKIDDYATFNWKAVADTINILGGIDLEISNSEFKYINSFITETVESTGIGSVHLKKAGMNHLDGVQAVAYARLRLMDTDYNRTARQRQVISLAMEKAKQADFSVLNNILVTILPQLSTSIGIDDMIPIAKNLGNYHLGTTDGFPFSRGEAKIGKKDCVIPLTLESNVIQLHALLYGVEDYQPSSTVKKISAKIASESGMGEVADNAPKTNTGGNSNDNSVATKSPAAETIIESTAEEPTTAESASETTAETTAETTSSKTEESSEKTPLESSKQEEIGPGINLKPTESSKADASTSDNAVSEKHPVGPGSSDPNPTEDKQVEDAKPMAPGFESETN
ncbi:MAG: LCP family protein [Hungatella sp.]